MKTVQEINDELLQASGLTPSLVKIGDDFINAAAGISSDDDEEEECMHWEHDHGVCMDCGEDRTEHFAGMAEDAFEGDR
jgi:hypothetical protein